MQENEMQPDFDQDVIKAPIILKWENVDFNKSMNKNKMSTYF